MLNWRASLCVCHVAKSCRIYKAAGDPILQLDVLQFGWNKTHSHWGFSKLSLGIGCFQNLVLFWKA